MNEKQLARALGLFSIGIGVAELVLPRTLGHAIGIKRVHRGALQALGAREIASGLGILSGRKPAGWLWSRVAGDILDLSLLGAAFAGRRNSRARLAAATAAVLGVTALDVFCGAKETRHSSRPGQKPRNDHTINTITINRSPEELYRFWRNFENLPRFMGHLQSVTVTSETRSHWVAKGPAGTTVEWDAELVQDKPNELIAWRSLPGSPVENAGSVRFEPATGEPGTVVRVNIQYHPPAGALGRVVAKLFAQSPEKQMAVELRRFKEFMETAENARTEY
jgi:uncharacterized membrane protein